MTVVVVVLLGDGAGPVDGGTVASGTVVAASLPS